MNALLSRYVDRDLEQLIVLALRKMAGDHRFRMTSEQREKVSTYADALENDTYLLETTTPPDEIELAYQRGRKDGVWEQKEDPSTWREFVK